MTAWVAEAHAHFQSLVLVVKMATVLEEFTTREECSLVRFFVGK
jgi:hypothetical protein